nr:PREDICTED: leucine-rich repeat-containing protein 4C-like [Lepisosteus oculatus]
MPGCLCGLLLFLFLSRSTHTHPWCPEGCCCPGPGSSVLCEGQGWRSLPRSVPPNVSALSVARNRLCDVDHLLLPFSRLRELSLSHNELSHFPRGLPSGLETLLLRVNRITYLTATSLRQLSNLTRLDMEDNRVRVIQAGTFQGLKQLRFLSLKGNRLSSIPDSLPGSLVHLDVSHNCISTLGLTSLASLVNLQMFKVNSNHLKFIPDRAFESLPSLKAVQLDDNLWACECDILYLYRWLLNSRLKMATDLVCAAPLHLARRLLLTLSVVAICPTFLRPNERISYNVLGLPHKLQESPRQALSNNAQISSSTPITGTYSLIQARAVKSKAKQNLSKDTALYSRQNQQNPQDLAPRYTLEEMNYVDCQAMAGNDVTSPGASVTSTAQPTVSESPRCSEDSTGSSPHENVTHVTITSVVLPTDKASFQPTILYRPVPPHEKNAIVALLAVLCVLVLLVLLAVILVLKKILERNRRVAPIEQS